MIAPMWINRRQAHAPELCQSIIKTSRDNHDSLSMHDEMKASLNRWF